MSKFDIRNFVHLLKLDGGSQTPDASYFAMFVMRQILKSIRVMGNGVPSVVIVQELNLVNDRSEKSYLQR